MITVILVKNPFSPKDGREIKHIEFEGTLKELKEQHKIVGTELLSTVNGHSCEDKELQDGDFVVLYPAVEKGGGKGKSILGIVAAIALSVVSFGVGGLVATGVWGSFAGASAMAAMGGYLAAAAIMFLGSSLIGRMTGQKVDNGSSYENEPTYSWMGVQTMEGQNNPIALTYGVVKSGGQTIGKYTQAQNDEDYLFWLVACGEGELAIYDIKLNDNDINLYQNVDYEVRSGTNDQQIISFFGDTHFTQNLSYNMALDTWYESAVQGTATEGVIVKIELPNGLYYVDDNGDMKSNYVKLVIEIQRDGGSWVDLLGEQTISASTNKAVRREYRMDRLTAGEYSARVKLTAIQHSNSTRAGFHTYWTGVSSIVYDDFSYPCTALIGIKAKATDQLSGSPALSFIKAHTLVYVWNPSTSTYETQYAYNPAWACYDLIHQCRRLKNINTNSLEYEVRGAPKELMRYDDFKAWADYCDEKNHLVNIEIVVAGDLLDVANEKIAPIGHGRVVRFGTKYGCIFAHPQEPVQMFGMGNIIEGSFREEFLKVADRANSVEVTFTNKDADYSRDVIAIYGDTYDSDGYAKTAAVTMDGITSFSQAYREGVYQLQCNKLQLRTVTFEAGIDAIACTVGDVIIIAHDVPQWTNSGRVESVDGNRILLPCEVPDPSAAQVLQWRSVDDVLHEHGCTVISRANGYTTVEMTYAEGEEAVYPEQYDVFSIAESATENKLFTVQNITRAQDFTRQISCIEYNEGVFEEPENYDGSGERPSLYVVTIRQVEHQTITVRKYRGIESIEYTDTFVEEETGWTIQVTIEPESGYAYGDITVNGFKADSGATFGLNKDYVVSAEAAEAGSVVYMNGSVQTAWGGQRYRLYSNSSCTQEVTKNTLTGKIIVKDLSGGLPADGEGLLGANLNRFSSSVVCSQITAANVASVNVAQKTSLAYDFAYCSQLLRIEGLENWNPENVRNMSNFCRGNSYLTEIGDISQWRTPYLTSLYQAFTFLGATSIDMHDWYTPALTSVEECFSGCTSLKVLDISGWDTTNISNVTNVVRNDASLEYVIMDSNDVKFSGDVSFPDANSGVIYLVRASRIAEYKAHANWSARASRIDDIANYVITRYKGHITVTPRTNS